MTPFEIEKRLRPHKQTFARTRIPSSPWLLLKSGYHRGRPGSRSLAAGALAARCCIRDTRSGFVQIEEIAKMQRKVRAKDHSRVGYVGQKLPSIAVLFEPGRPCHLGRFCTCKNCAYC